MICNAVDNYFLKPITVSETMSQDIGLKKIMLDSAKNGGEDAEEAAVEYLSSIKDGFDYQMVFAVVDENKAYYTYKGLSKYLDTENNSHDSWYTNYLNTGKHYDLDIDTDENNSYDLTVFVNTEVLDEDGKYIGVCGVGVEISALQKMLHNYEDEYDLKINIIDGSGQVVVDTEGNLISERDLNIPERFLTQDDEYHFDYTENDCRVVKYIDDLGWYMVVEEKNPEMIDTKKLITPVIIVFGVGMLVTLSIIIFSRIGEIRKERELEEKTRIALTDGLTGSFNRRAYEADTLDISYKNKENRVIMLLMDVNGLKRVNDTIGHEAGDEMIKGAAECMKKAFKAYGKVYRTGGDEFVVIAECTKSKMEPAIKQFDNFVAEWRGQLVNELAVAKGIVYGVEHPHITIEEMMRLADERMYVDKNDYYTRTGHDRRRS